MGKITWAEANSLQRGHTLDMKLVVYVHKINATYGRGMGDTPASIVWVLENGEVWEMTDPGWLVSSAVNPRRVMEAIK